MALRSLTVLTILLIVPALNSLFAQTRIKWVAPAAALTVKNALGAGSGMLAGKTLYTNNCAPCHGEKGKGNGPASGSLNPKPADHSSAAFQNQTDGSIFWKISEGRSPMPAYKAILTDQQRWSLVSFIRTLQKK